MSLPTKINQLRDPLPARASRRRILPLTHELLRLLCHLSLLLLDLAVIRLVEAINVLLRRRYRLLLLALRRLVAPLQLAVPLPAPRANRLRVCLDGPCRRVVRVAGAWSRVWCEAAALEGQAAVRYGAAGANVLFLAVSFALSYVSSFPPSFSSWWMWFFLFEREGGGNGGRGRDHCVIHGSEC